MITIYKLYTEENQMVNDDKPTVNNDYPILFKNLQINDCFHDGLKDASYPHKGFQYIKYIKKNGREGKCIDQVGYGNIRAIGGEYLFSQNKLVYKC